ncbi:hypothetical protein [Bradyrhizobium sp. MOS001]|nr:hypothetical protein [Bradyrhizobium sp. MOS001]
MKHRTRIQKHLIIAENQQGRNPDQKPSQQNQDPGQNQQGGQQQGGQKR